VVEREMQSQDSKHHDHVSTRAAVTKRLFESEQDDIRQWVVDERERIYQDALKKWTEAQKGADTVEHQQQ
jgi:hypothetical protein